MFLCKYKNYLNIFFINRKHYGIYLYRKFNNYRDYKVLYVSDLYVYSHISETSSYPSRIFMHNSNTLQLVKAFRITKYYFPVVIQNSYNSSMINVIFTERQTFFFPY